MEALVGNHRRPVAAVVVDGDGMTAAWLDADVDADYEIGSVSKAVTGLLYQHAVDRGEVTPDTTLGDLLVLPGSRLAAIRLGALAVHRSGLPRLPGSAHSLRRTWALLRHGTNPYGEALVERLDQAGRVVPGRPKARYSNLGFELLGHAVAAAVGLGFSDLLAVRLADPLHLDGVFIPADAGKLRYTSLIGSDRRGHRKEAWTGEALAPAGGIRASITDMGRLVSALVDRTAPGVGALDPVSPFTGRSRIGAAWMTVDVAGSAISWHQRGHGWLPQLGRRRQTARAGGGRPVGNDPIGRSLRFRTAGRRSLRTRARLSVRCGQPVTVCLAKSAGISPPVTRTDRVGSPRGTGHILRRPLLVVSGENTR